MRIIMVRYQGSMLRSAFLLSCLALAPACSILGGCGVQYISSPLPPRERGAQPAAVSLLNDAEQALHSGESLKAEEYLERALRIEPQNPLLWNALARSKFQQGKYPQTIQMTLKSNSCLPDRATERSNWLLMEKAYLAMGDAEKAKNARAKALD